MMEMDLYVEQRQRGQHFLILKCGLESVDIAGPFTVPEEALQDMSRRLINAGFVRTGAAKLPAKAND